MDLCLLTCKKSDSVSRTPKLKGLWANELAGDVAGTKEIVSHFWLSSILRANAVYWGDENEMNRPPPSLG